jgi:lipopolysaccharide heptosyltransferase II
MQDILHRTLIIRFSSVGDIVLSSLLVRALRQRFPALQIDFVVKTEFAELVADNPHLNRVIAFPTGGTYRDLRTLRRAIRRAGYDLIIDIHDSLRSRFLCAGARNVVRVNKRKIPRFFLVKFKWNLYQWFGGAPGVAERYLETVQHLGVKDDGKGLELFLPQKSEEDVAKILRDAGFTMGSPLVGICPSARHWNKMWLKERFAETAASLSASYHATVVLFGSTTEEKRCGEVEAEISRLNAGVPVLNLAGRLTLVESAAVMDRCVVIITNDSGLMHMATARNRKVVAVFGPTVRELGFFPTGTLSMVVEDPLLECRPCTHVGLPECPKGHFRCMMDIPASRVIDAAEQLLSQA